MMTQTYLGLTGCGVITYCIDGCAAKFAEQTIDTWNGDVASPCHRDLAGGPQQSRCKQALVGSQQAAVHVIIRASLRGCLASIGVPQWNARCLATWRTKMTLMFKGAVWGLALTAAYAALP